MLELSADTATPASPGWAVPIIGTVGTDGTGVVDLWTVITAHRAHIGAAGVLEQRRRFRLGEELREIVARRLERRARELCTGERWNELTDGVLARTIDPWTAADEMLEPVLTLTPDPTRPDQPVGSGPATPAGTSTR